MLNAEALIRSTSVRSHVCESRGLQLERLQLAVRHTERAYLSRIASNNIGIYYADLLGRTALRAVRGRCLAGCYGNVINLRNVRFGDASF